MADGSVVIDTKLDESGLKSGLAKLGTTALAGVAAATTAIAALGGEVINVGSKFESSFAAASTAFGTVNVNTDSLKTNLLSMAGAVGVTADELTNSLYSALSAGAPATADMAESLALVKGSAKLAIAGFTDTDTALNATLGTMNAYGLGMAETNRVQQVLMQTQNLGKVTVGELGTQLSQVTPIAAAMGVSVEQLGSSVALLTVQGVPAAQATTKLNGLIAELGKSGTIGQKGLAAATEGTKYAGMSFKEMMDSGATLPELLDLMSTEASSNGLALADMFGSIEAGSGALLLSGANTEKFNTILGQMGGTTDYVGEAYTKVMDTFDKQKDVFFSSATSLGQSVYQNIQEPLKNMAKFGTESIGKLGAAFQSGGLEGLVSAAGTVLSDVVTKIAEFAPKVIEAAMSLIESLVKGLVGNMQAITNAVMQIITNILLSITGMLPMLVEGGMLLLTGLIQGVSEMLPQILPAVTKAIVGMVQAIISNAPAMVDAAIQLVNGLVRGLLQAIPYLTGMIPQLIQELCKFITDSVPQLIGAAIALVNGIIMALPTIIAAIVTAIPTIVQAIVDMITTLLPQIIEAGIDLFMALITALPDIINQLVLAIPKIINSLLSAIVDLLPVVIDAGVKLFMALVNALPEIISGIIGVIPVILAALVSTLLGSLQQIIEAGLKLFLALVDALPEIIIGIVAVLPQIITSVITALLDSIPLIIQCGIDLLMSLIAAMPDIIVSIVAVLPTLIQSIIKALMDNLPLLIDCGIDLFMALIDALPAIIKSLIAAAPQIVDALVGAFKTLVGKLKDVGKNLLEGLWNGLNDGKEWLIAKVKELVGAVTDSIKKFFGISSPSKLFKNEIGKNLMLGLCDGIVSETSAVQRAMGGISNLIAGTNIGLPNVGGVDLGSVYQKVMATVSYSGSNNPSAVSRASNIGFAPSTSASPVSIYLDGKLISENCNKHNFTRGKVGRIE